MLQSTSIIERGAIPTAPSSPQPLPSYLLIVLVTTFAGLAAAISAELLDNTIKSHEDIEIIVKRPFLGTIPLIASKSPKEAKEAHKRDLYMLDNPRSSLAECTRNIRTNILLMHPDMGQNTKSILVTSSGPKEGKTTTAINLAISMAQAGSKTLLIDGDMRRPRIHKSFGVSSEKGITSVLCGEATLEEVLVNTPTENLSLLPCGPIPPNPAELMHSKAFLELWTNINEEFDRVVVDTPPVNAVTDPAILSALTDTVVFVVRAMKTTIPATLRSIHTLSSINANIAGIVLNDVDFENAKNPYYYYYYQRYYKNDYYQEADKHQDKAA